MCVLKYVCFKDMCVLKYVCFKFCVFLNMCFFSMCVKKINKNQSFFEGWKVEGPQSQSQSLSAMPARPHGQPARMASSQPVQKKVVFGFK